MDDRVQQNLLKYFCPVRRCNHRTPCKNTTNFVKAVKRTSKSSQVVNFTRISKNSECSNQAHCFNLEAEPSSSKLEETNEIDATEEPQGEFFAVADLHQQNSDYCFQSKTLPEHLEVEYSLETVAFPQQSSTAFQSISAETLCKILLSMSAAEFNKKFILVDCRYPFEYSGGHIKGAVNLYDPNEIASTFFIDSERLPDHRRIPIFYCEFSQKRSPAMAHSLRAFDRERNERRYPFVDYKEMYLLDRGYSAFYNFARNLDLCEPNRYTKMVDSEYVLELRKYSFHQNSRTIASFNEAVSNNRRSAFRKSSKRRVYCNRFDFPETYESFCDTSRTLKNSECPLKILQNMDTATNGERSLLPDSPTQFQQLSLPSP